MKLLATVCVLLCLVEVCLARVTVDADDIMVTCGNETVNSFGDISISINVSASLWDATNYTIYAFENPTPDGSGPCDFKQEPFEYLNPLVTDNTTYTGYYTWNGYSIQPKLEVGKSDPCGWTRTTASRIQIDIAVVEGTLFTTNDKVFRITCDYDPETIKQAEVGEADIIPGPPEVGGTAKPNALDRIYNLELVAADTGRIIEGTVPIGTQVQLRVRAEGLDDGKDADLVDINGAVAGDENGMQVGSCYATNSDDKQAEGVTLITDYCTEFKDGVDFVDPPNPEDRKGFTSIDLLSFSPAFEMFALTGGAVDHVVIFRCTVTICRLKDVCNGDNCPSKRRKRDTSPKMNALSVFRQRRAAQSVAGQTMLSMSIVVNDAGVGGNSVVAAVGMSAQMTTLVIALTVVGVLLMLCVVAAIAVAMRFTKAKRNTDKTTVVHHDNAAFQH